MHTWLAVIVLFFCVIAVVQMDYDDEMREQEIYCKMVSGGHWPAYRKDEINCEELKND